MKPDAFARYAFGSRHIILLAVVLAIVAGLGSIQNNERSEDTPIGERFATVITFWPGATPKRMELQVVEHLEQEIMSLREVAEVEATITEGSAVLFIELQDYVPADEVDPIWSQVANKVDRARRFLPPGAVVDAPNKAGPVAHSLIIALTSDRYDIHWLTRTAEYFERRMAVVEGTQEVNVLGSVSDEIVVEPDFAALYAAGISENALLAALRSADTKQGLGALRLESQLLVAELADPLTSVAGIADIPVLTPQGMRRLGDFASVRLGAIEPTPIAELNGKQAVFVAIRAQQHQRVDQWAKRAASLFEELAAELPADVEATIAFDQSDYIDGRLANLSRNFIAALILVTLITAFLMGGPSGLVIASSLPLTIAITLSLFPVFGVGLHQLSITGLMISLGLLIDNAIVVVDGYASMRKRGHSAEEALYATVNYLFKPLIASSLTTALAFMPIFMGTGPASEFVGPMAKAVSTAIMVSYALSMTILPTMLAIIDEKFDFISATEKRAWWLSGWSHPDLTKIYARTLRYVISSRTRTMSVALALPVIGFVLVTTLNSQFFPRAKRDMFEILIQTSSSYDHQGIVDVARQVDDILVEQGWITQRMWFMGGPSGQVYYNSIETRTDDPTKAYGAIKAASSQIVIDKLPELQLLLRDALPGVMVRVQPFGNGPPIFAPISFEIKGSNLDTLRRHGREIQSVLNSVEGITYTDSDLSSTALQLRFELDKAAAAHAVVQENALIEPWRIRLEGLVVGTMADGTRDIPIRVRAADEHRAGLTDLLQTPVHTPQGRGVVAGLGDIALVPAPSNLYRMDGRRVNRVQGYIMPYELPSVVQGRVDKALEEANLGVPYGIELGSQGEAGEAGEAMAYLFEYGEYLHYADHRCFGGGARILPRNRLSAADRRFVPGSGLFWNMGFRRAAGIHRRDRLGGAYGHSHQRFDSGADSPQKQQRCFNRRS